MRTCNQCQEEMKEVKQFQNKDEPLYYCKNPKCPDFLVLLNNMSKPIKIEEQVIDLYEAVFIMEITPNQARKAFMKLLSSQQTLWREKMITEIKKKLPSHSGGMLSRKEVKDILSLIQKDNPKE